VAVVGPITDEVAAVSTGVLVDSPGSDSAVLIAGDPDARLETRVALGRQSSRVTLDLLEPGLRDERPGPTVLLRRVERLDLASREHYDGNATGYESLQKFSHPAVGAFRPITFHKTASEPRKARKTN